MTSYVKKNERAVPLQTETDVRRLDMGAILFVLFMVIFFTGLTAGFAVGVMQ